MVSTPTAASPPPPNPAPNPLSNAPPPPPVQPFTPHANPKVAELQLMFPTIEVEVIEMILESCGGSQDRAIEQLLSMTDPEFRPDELAHSRQEEASQLDLDAEFARSLHLQDEEQRRSGGRPLPYQPRVRHRPPPGQGQPGGFYNPPSDAQRGENPPGMLAMEDKLNQFAEAGKQTFSSLFNRAKAKYEEFQQTTAANTAAREDAQRQQVGQERMGQGWRSPSPQGYGTPTPGGGRGGQQNDQKGLWGDQSSRSTSFSSQSAEPPAKAPRWQPSDAYDDPLPAVGAPSNKIEVTGRRSPAVGSMEKPAPSGKIDAAKLGLLPKKRVDLMSTSPPVATQQPVKASNESDEEDGPNPGLPSTGKSVVNQIPKTPPPKANNPYSFGDSDDDLEYTKNPFDER